MRTIAPARIHRHRLRGDLLTLRASEGWWLSLVIVGSARTNSAQTRMGPHCWLFALSYDCSVLRALAALVAALCIGTACASCGGDSRATPGASGTVTTSGNAAAPNATSGTSGSAEAQVSSVSAVVQPKSPLSAKAAPAERVTFRVSSGHGPLSCKIDVLRSGQVVGSAVTQIGSSATDSASGTESVAVEGIHGGTFAGTPSDASVVCSAR